MSIPPDQLNELAKRLGLKPTKAELAEVAALLTQMAHAALRRPPLPDVEWVTVSGAARIGSCGESTVRRAVRRGFVTARRFGSRNTRVNLASWRQFLSDGPGQRIRPPNNPTPNPRAQSA